MNTNNLVCLLRTTNFRGKIYQSHFDHNVILVCRHKDDSFIDVLDLQQFISGQFSMLLNGIHVRCIAPEELWNMGHLQSFDGTIYNKYYKTVIEVLRGLGQHTLKPTYVLTDDEYFGEIMSDDVPFYTVYPSMRLCQPKLNRTIEALCLEKPIDIRNPLHRLHLSGFFRKRKTLRFPVKQFLRDIPEQYVLYFALGTYRQEYNYPDAIRALYTLLKYANHPVKHKVFLALGGNFNDYNVQDEEYYHILLSSVRADLERFNILFLDRISTTDKKALLRRSTAMIYLNGQPGYNPDLRLSLSVGCPIITVKAGYAEYVIIHGYSGFHVDKSETIKIAVQMYKLVHPSKREYHSECARKHYIKEHTLTHYTLDSFREEDTPRPTAAVPKKGRKNTKRRSKSKVVEIEDVEPQAPLQLNIGTERDTKRRILLFKSFSTNTLYPQMEKKTLLKTPSLTNIKIDTTKPEQKVKSKKGKKHEKTKSSKPKHRLVEEMDDTPRTLLRKSKSATKLNTMPKAAPAKPPARPAPKVFKRTPEPPTMIRAVGAFTLKKEPPKDEPPNDD